MSCLLQSWQKFQKDYGAIYFLVILLRNLDTSLGSFKKLGMELVEHCLDDSWSPFMKFKPQAIFLAYKFDAVTGSLFITLAIPIILTPFFITIMSVSE